MHAQCKVSVIGTKRTEGHAWQVWTFRRGGVTEH